MQSLLSNANLSLRHARRSHESYLSQPSSLHERILAFQYEGVFLDENNANSGGGDDDNGGRGEPPPNNHAWADDEVGGLFTT
jgi:hypothetical protein